MKGLRLLVLACTLLAGARAVDAQEQPVRQGWWAEIGAGTGGVWVGCATCEEPTAYFGESTYLRGGGAFSERVLWGVEVFTLLNRTFQAAQSRGPSEVENMSLAPIVLWYPWRGSLFVKGGVGLARSEVRVPGPVEGETIRVRGTGSGLTFGAGFDVPLLSWLAVTTNFGVYFGAVGDVSVPPDYVDDVITTMYNVNFALTLR